MTLRGTRVQAEHAFCIPIKDFERKDRTFFANDKDPALPVELVGKVDSIEGLTNSAMPRPSFGLAASLAYFFSKTELQLLLELFYQGADVTYLATLAGWQNVFNLTLNTGIIEDALAIPPEWAAVEGVIEATRPSPFDKATPAIVAAHRNRKTQPVFQPETGRNNVARGTGQNIGIVAFSSND